MMGAQNTTKHVVDKNRRVTTYNPDNSLSTWLKIKSVSEKGANDVTIMSIDDFLLSLKGQICPIVCWYSGSHLDSTRDFVDGNLKTRGTQWTCKVKSSDKSDASGKSLDLKLTFKLLKGNTNSAGIAVAFDFTHWSPKNYVLIPGSIYNGNRNRIEDRSYASGLNREDLYKKDLKLTTASLPQLSPEFGKLSRIEVNACNATTPAMCFYSKQYKRGFIVLTDQGVSVGDSILDNGFIIEESPDRSNATFAVSAPGVRNRKPEFIGFSKSPDRGIQWKAGDELTLHLRIYSFVTPNIPGLLEKFMTVRKAVTGKNHPRNLFPFSEIIKLMEKNIDNRFYNGEKYQFYCPENAKWISFGWIGGLMNTFPMLELDDSFHLDRVIKTFDFAIPRGQGKSGYFYGALNYDGKDFGREGYDEYPEICLTRKNGDVLYWMIKQFDLLKAQNRSYFINPIWETSMKRLAQAFVNTWDKDGQWGNFVNVQTGDVAVYNTTSGASAIGGLALAAKYFNDPEFLKIAEKAALFYYNHDFVNLGMTTGGCSDILQNASSETSFAFMTSLMVLYELTGEKVWLVRARNLANLCATWVVSYDYKLPLSTELGKLGAKLTGVVWASTQNKHGAPGICTSSGSALFKIYRATSDLRYADLLRDIVHAYAEGIKPSGRITERLNYCDADAACRGFRPSGETGWTELNGILMAMELPGIYFQTDRDEIYVFDSVEAKILKRTKNGVMLLITNPTKYDANISIFAEPFKESKKPIGCTGFLKWPKVEVKKGKTELFYISNHCCPVNQK
jgi:hypothetical protein